MIRANTIMPLMSVLGTLLILTSCAQPAREKNQSELLTPIPVYGAAPLIRVKLATPTEKSSVTVDAGKATLTIDGKRIDLDGPITVSQQAGRVSAGAHGTGTSVEIVPTERPEHFDVDGRIYRGKLRLVATNTGWEAINVVDLEQYVAGVVGWEMIAGWPVEALKAQAIASRTYALFEMEHSRGSGRNWDVDDTTRYQVYGGVGPAANPKQWRETANVRAAREGTAGEVLTFRPGFPRILSQHQRRPTANPSVASASMKTFNPSSVDLGDYDKDSPSRMGNPHACMSEGTPH
ncbi:MAG: SpoIID/LytB domain-containing protein [Planctomycetota bacterium]